MSVPGIISIVTFIISLAPTIVKIGTYVIDAAKNMEGKTGAEKRDWVMEQLRLELPKFKGDKLYDAINMVVSLLRTMGLKI
jgi:hypothetical protein